MQRIIVRHLSGSKANQVEEFPLNHFKEVILGRDPSCSVKYDPDRDDLVGRQHSKIAPDASDPSQFTITDLSSRNGTYVNKQRIGDPTRIVPGDLIQLGPGGPEFQFDLEPRPLNTVKATRSSAFESLASTVQAGAPIPATRQVDLSPPQTRSVVNGASPSSTSSTGNVGKATVERMISQNIAITKRTEGRKYMMMGGGALAAVVILFAAVAGYLWYRNRSSETQIGRVLQNAPMSATAIAQSKGNAVVMIEVSWKLIAPDGGLVYHKGECPGPCFIEVKDGVIEPVLVDEQHSTGGRPINGTFTASGFVVSNDGFILTNRHVVYAWKSVYPFQDLRFGTLIKPNGVVETIDPSRIAINWVPESTTMEKQTNFFINLLQISKKSTKKLGERGTLSGFTGVNDKLEVAFPGTSSRIAAQLVRAADDQDVAMIKISVPDSTPKVDPYDNYESIKQGDTAIVMGYPETSPPIYGFAKSQTNNTRLREIPDPTVSVGNIGRLIRPRKEMAGKRETLNVYGDAFQLSVSSTGHSNSGGPVFDDRGRVIGIFTAPGNDSSIAFAIPIRYGQELMSVGASAK